MVASFTVFGVPTAKACPQSSIQIWYALFGLGKSIMPPVAGVVALSYAYAAWDARSQDKDWVGYLAAAGLMVSIVPFTIIVMSSTIDPLENAVLGSTTLSASQVADLMGTWGTQNIFRSLLPLSGAVVGFLTF